MRNFVYSVQFQFDPSELIVIVGHEQNIIKIIDIFTESVNNLIDIYNTIKSEATKNL